MIFHILEQSRSEQPVVFLCLKQDYLHSLGKGRTAQVQKDARIGEAQNKRDAVIRVRSSPTQTSSLPHGVIYLKTPKLRCFVKRVVLVFK